MNVKVDFDSLNSNIEELVKRSKYLQNKMRQELNRQSENSPGAGLVRKELPPVEDESKIIPYVKNIVAAQLQDKSSELINSNEMKYSNVKEVASKSDALDGNGLPSAGNSVKLVPNVRSSNRDDIQDKSSLSLKSNKHLKIPGLVSEGSKGNVQKMESKQTPVRASLFCSRSMTASIGTQFEKPKTKKMMHKCASTSKTTQRSVSKQSPLRASKSCLESNKSLNKLSTTTLHRFPLQRFSESSLINVDFSKEHPDLELDVTTQTTLFPRRFHRQTESIPAEDESVNVAEAELKPPQPTTVAAVVQQETWNGILSKNRPKRKQSHKIVRLRQEVDAVENISKKDLPLQRPNNEEPKEAGLDIIASTQANGLFMLQKQSDRLAKQKMCRFQRFPVMYIRPACKVQKVANISISCGEEENPSGNIKYVECKHEDRENVELHIGPDSLRIDEQENDDGIQANAKKNNRFFKAFEFSSHCENSASSSKSSPLTQQLSTSNPTLSSSSSVSSKEHENPSENINKLHNIVAKVNHPSELLLSPKVTQDVVKSPPTRREVHVQTEYEHKKTVATSTSPLPTTPAQSAESPPEQEMTSSVMNNTLNKLSQVKSTASQRTPEIDDSVKDDIIKKIFERIRNDVPNALQAFKNRKTTASINSTIPPVSEEQYQEQKHPHQMSAISDVSNIEIEPHLGRVQGKRQSHNISQSQIVSIDPTPAPTSMPVLGRDLVLLQQNPLFVQTINRIKSSAIHDEMPEDESTKQKRHEYPTNAEIKRAVKIFIDSLTFDGCGGGEKKAIINDNVYVGGARRKFMPLPKPELINSERFSKYTSSESSNSSASPIISSSNNRRGNVKRMSKTSRWCSLSGSSTSTGLSSSDLESEIDITNDMPRLLLNQNNSQSSSKSDGEVKSIGEI